MHSRDLLLPVRDWKLEAAQQLVNASNAALRSSNVLITTLLSICAFIALTLLATNHEELVQNKEVALPLFQVSIPPWVFFLGSPFTVLILHVILLLHMRLTMAKVWEAKRAIDDLQNSNLHSLDDQKELQHQLHVSSLAQLVIPMPDRDRFTHYLSVTSSLFQLVLVSQLTMLHLLCSFLPTHEVFVSFLQSCLLILDLYLVVTLCPKLMSPASEPKNSGASRRELFPRLVSHRVLYGKEILSSTIIVAAATMAILMLASAGIFSLDLRDKVLSAGSLIPKLENGLRSEKGLDFWNQNGDKIRPFRLTYSDLRRARFDNTLIAAADFRCTNLLDASFQGGYLHGARFGCAGDIATNLRNVNFEHAVLTGADFRGAVLTDASMIGAYLEGANFRSMDGRRTDLSRASLDDARLPGARLGGALMTGSSAEGAHFNTADLSGAELSNGRWNKAVLTGATLKKTRMDDIFLESARMSRVIATEVDLSGAQLSDAILVGAKLDSANLERTQLNNANMVGASLFDANLIGARLWKSEARFADMNSTKLEGASGEGMDLRGAVLRAAKFGSPDDDPESQTKFAGADLRGADLRGTAWPDLDLENADLGLTDLRGRLEPRCDPLGNPADCDRRWRELVQSDSPCEMDNEQCGQVLRKLARSPEMPCLLDKAWGPCLGEDQIETYDRKLAEFLVELACKNFADARGLEKRLEIEKSSDPERELVKYLKRKIKNLAAKQQAGECDPPPSSDSRPEPESV